MKYTNEEILKEILEQSLAGYWDWDIPSGYEYLSPSFKKMFGYEDHEIENRVESWQKLVYKEDLPAVFEKFNQHVQSRGEIPYYSELRYHHKNGSAVWVICTGKVIEWDEKGNAKRMVGCHIDITHRKQAEISLRESEERFHDLFEKAPLGYQSLDSDGTFIEVNQAWLETLGYSRKEVIGKWFGDFLAPEYVQAYRERFPIFLKQGKIHSDFYLIHKDGSRKYIAFDGRVGHNTDGSFKQTHCILKDETERKRLDEVLQRAQKLESLGLLAGGIAHDFNNLMGGIFGYIEMASGQTNEENVTSCLSKAMNTIDRARALTRQLLTFAKGGAPIQQIGSLFPFVEETAKFALSGSSVVCRFDVPGDLWSCNFDKNQIGQVIDNLIINAQQAMPVGGRIDLIARNITLAEKEHPLLEKGNYVEISVKDSGVGIPKELISQIFDPFFTTKSKGHGLGLATCYSIINRHNGCIDVESEPGKGSIFKVYLPAEEETVSPAAGKLPDMHTGCGTFLVMDDEPVVRDTISGLLETFGYTVISRENGQDAIDFFETETRANRKIAGMIFDLTVPGGMGGKEAIEKIRKTNTTIPAFVSSGYADDPVMENPAEHGFMASICKPFRRSELSDMLNRYMNTKK